MTFANILSSCTGASFIYLFIRNTNVDG